MPRVRGVDDDEEYEILDVRNRGWMERTFRDLTKASVAKQLSVGGVSGWCAGYLFGKVGKAAAAAVGGSLLLLQVAHHQGYITVNWSKVDQSVKKAKRKIQNDADTIIPMMVQEVQEFVTQNVFLAGGFTGGFLIGLAS